MNIERLESIMKQFTRQVLLPLFLLTAGASAADATIIPHGRSISAYKKMELKPSSFGVDNWGSVQEVSQQHFKASGRDYLVSFGVSYDSTCYLYLFKRLFGGGRYDLEGRSLSCSNYWSDDETFGNNNGQALQISGWVRNHATGQDEFINGVLWPKRDDRIKATFYTPRGVDSWEFDIAE